MARGLQVSRPAPQQQPGDPGGGGTESDHLTEYQPRYCVVLMEHINRRYESWQKAKMCFCTCALLSGSFTLAALLGYWFFSLDNPTGDIYVDNLYLHVTFNTSRYFELRDGPKHSDQLLLKGDLGLSIPKVALFKTLAKNHTHVHITWNPYAELKLLHSAQGSTTCYEFIWIGQGGVLGNRLEDCLELGHNTWYGTFMNDNNDIKLPKESKWYWTPQEEVWLDFDSLSFTENDNTMERYWLSSNGVAVHVSSDVPLKGRLSREKSLPRLCLRAALKNHSFHDPYTPLHLRYSVCASQDIKTVHKYMIKKYALHPGKEAAQETPLFRDILWMNPSENTGVLTQQFAQRLLDEGYEKSAIVMDMDRLTGNVLWQPGAVDSNMKTAPLSLLIPSRVSALLEEISAMGFCLVTRIPFVKLLRYSVSSEVSYQSNKCNIECVNLNDETVANIFTSNMVSVLNNLKRRYNICSFWLDMQEAPSEQNIASPHLQTIAHNLVTSLQMCCPNSISTVAFGAQQASLFIKLRNIKPNWGRAHGLRSVIPAALKLSILGYPYIIPPGFTQHISVNSTSDVVIPGSSSSSLLPWLPDPELYIRWIQLISVFPVVSMTVPPWMFQDSNLSHAVQEALNTRQQLLPTILQLVKQTDSGQPILRPLWWLEPKNPKLHSIEDEFLLGDTVLVAPVLKPGARSRDIYFPSGHWKDQQKSRTIKGGQWHRNCKVSLNRLPYFLRIDGP